MTNTGEKSDESRGGIGSLELLPTGPANQTMTAWEMAGLWMSLVVSVPSYYVAGNLVEKGMSSWQGITVVVLGNAILLLPLLLTSQPAARYGIPFPVLARASFGVHGAQVPALIRTFASCGWFAIETWMGGQAIYILLPSSFTKSSYAHTIPWLATSPLELLCFALFWLVQVLAVLNGTQGIRKLEKHAAPILLVLVSVLLGWAYVRGGGFGPMLSQPSRLSPSEFWALFVPSITANTGSWAAMALSIPDITRYARSQKDQVLGQIGLPFFMGEFAFVGLAVTSSTKVIFGRVISNPIDLLAEIGGTFTLSLAVPAICFAILTTNVPANMVSPANALVSISPSIFTFRRGAVLTAVAGAVLFQPWRILNSPDNFIYTWLIGYSAILGPISGIMLTDYYVTRRMFLAVDDLYTTSPRGEYYYSGGYNLVAMTSLVLSLLPVVPGLLVKMRMLESVPKIFIFVYDIGWFFGLFMGGFLYLTLSCCVRRLARRGDGGDCDAKITAKKNMDPQSSLKISLLITAEK